MNCKACNCRLELSPNDYGCAHAIAAVESLGGGSKIADFMNYKDTLAGWRSQIEGTRIIVPLPRNRHLFKGARDAKTSYPPAIKDINEEGKEKAASGRKSINDRGIGHGEQSQMKATEKRKREKKGR